MEIMLDPFNTIPGAKNKDTTTSRKVVQQSSYFQTAMLRQEASIRVSNVARISILEKIHTVNDVTQGP